MSRWIPRWLERRQAILGNDATTTAMMSKLGASAVDGSSGMTHDLERAALALQIGSSQRIDSASRRKLKSAVFRVENAERRYRMANARVDRFKNGALVRTFVANERAEAARAEARADKEIDSTAPHVSPLVVALAELVLLIAEFAFYYKIFGGGLQEDALVIERVFVAVLAVLVPVVGIMSARFFAGSVQHLRSPHDGGHNGPRRSSIVFVVVSTTLLIVAAYSTLRLVEWRYQAEDADNPGVVSHPPGTIMAVVFVVFILVDALTRAFMFDPAERTSIGRRWKGRYTRTVDWWLLRRESAALARWQKRWFSAMTLVEKLKNGADQELLTATVSILISRGDKGSDGSQLHGWPAESVPGARVADGAQLMSKVTHTTGAPAEQLNENNAHIFLQHRLVRLAEARLEIIKPPEDPQQERREPTEDLTQFERPTRPEARDPEPAPPPHNMSQIGPEGIAS